MRPTVRILTFLSVLSPWPQSEDACSAKPAFDTILGREIAPNKPNMWQERSSYGSAQCSLHLFVDWAIEIPFAADALLPVLFN